VTADDENSNTSNHSAAGIVGKGHNFDGDTHIKLPTDLGGSSVLGSISLWVKTDEDFSNRAMLWYGAEESGGNGDGDEDFLWHNEKNSLTTVWYLKNGSFTHVIHRLIHSFCG